MFIFKPTSLFLFSDVNRRQKITFNTVLKTLKLYHFYHNTKEEETTFRSMVVVKISIVLLHAKIILTRKAKQKFHDWPNVENGKMVELKAED